MPTAEERFYSRLDTYSKWLKQEQGKELVSEPHLLKSLTTHFRAFIEVEHNKPIDELNAEDLSLEDMKLAAYGGWAWGWSNADFIKATRYKAFLFRPKQRIFWHKGVIFPAYVGAWRSGKTVIGCLKGLWLSHTYPGTKGILVRNTYPELMDTTVSSLIKIFDYFEWEDGREYRHKVGDKKFLIKVAENTDSIIDYRPAREQNETLDSAVNRFKGYEPDWGLISEASDIEQRVVLTLMGRRGQWGKIIPENNRYGKEYYRPWHKVMMLETNPPDDEHYLYKRYVKKELPDGEKIKPDDIAEQHWLIMASTYENKRNLDTEYIQTLEAMDDVWKRQYLYGQWGYMPPEGEPVYNFRYETYVRKDFLKYHPELPMIRGWDLGTTDKWKACIVCQLDPKGILLCLLEIIRTEPGIEQFGLNVQRQCNLMFPEVKQWRDFSDPVAVSVKSQTDQKSAADVLRPLGINLIPGDSDFGIRRDAVVSTMSRNIDGFPAMLISEPNCRVLVKGFMGGYRYKIVRTDTGQFSKQPVNDQFAHIHTGFQYLCTRLGFADTKKLKNMLNQIKQKNPHLYDKQKQRAFRSMMNR